MAKKHTKSNPLPNIGLIPPILKISPVLPDLCSMIIRLQVYHNYNFAKIGIKIQARFIGNVPVYELYLWRLDRFKPGGLQLSIEPPGYSFAPADYSPEWLTPG